MRYPASFRSSCPGVEIVLVTNNFPPIRGGSASVYANLARCAAGKILVLAPTTDYTDGLPLIGWREHDRCAPYPVKRLPLLRTTVSGRKRASLAGWIAWDLSIRLRLCFRLLIVILRDGPRVVCVGELLASGWLFRVLRWVPGVRTIAYVHGEEITTDDVYDRFHHRALRSLQDCDRVVVVSRFTQTKVETLLGHASAPILKLIQNGVDNRRFRPCQKSAALVTIYNLAGCFVFVSVARLVQKKGTDNAIRAFAQVAIAYPDCRLLIVGSGPYQERLQEIATGMMVAEKVIFTGAVAEDDLVEHYQLGDVFIMPNRELPDGDTEGFGLVFLEANACGMPVIAGRDGGSTEAVQDGVNGLVVDGRSVHQIARAMLSLREDPILYASLQRQALDKAARSDWDAKTQAFLDFCTTSTDALAT